MKIIKLPNSWLFLRVKPENDTVTCFFIFFISWNVFQCEKKTFDLNKLSLYLVKQIYVKLANDWDRKYRI